MRLNVLSFVCGVLLVGCGAAPEIGEAQGAVKIKGGPSGGVNFTDGGLTLTAAGALTGIGHIDGTLTLLATGSAKVSCISPGGERAPGVNKNNIEVSGAQAVSMTETKNGSLSFSITTDAPPAPSWSDAGCPNAHWTVSIDDMTFVSAEIHFVQGEQMTLDQTWTL
jgi:hypothetical protein